MDHRHMVFEMFRLDRDSGEVRKLAPDDIERDTSGYDDEGNDPGIAGPVTPHGGTARPVPPHGGAGPGHGDHDH